MDESEQKNNAIATASAENSSGIQTEILDDKDFHAIKNFVATLEGQITVYKNEALILLDDSNSYWWLVRVKKTGDMGYIPAENIENGNERLARLNRERNVEVTLAKVYDVGEQQNYNGMKKAVSFDHRNSVQCRYFVVEAEEEEEDLESINASGDDLAEMPEDSESNVNGAAEDEEAEVKEPRKPTLLNKFVRRLKRRSFGSIKEKSVQVLRIFASATCQTDALYKTVLAAPNTSIEEVTLEAVDRFHLIGGIEDYYLTVIDLEDENAEEIILDKNATITEAINDLKATLLKDNPKKTGDTFFYRFNHTNVFSVHQANITKNAIGSFWGSNSGSKKLKSIRFVLNKKVNYGDRISFFIRVYMEGANTSDQHNFQTYKTVAVDSLMKVRDVICLALSKFNSIPEPNKIHELYLCKKDEGGKIECNTIKIEMKAIRLYRNDKLVNVFDTNNMSATNAHFKLTEIDNPSKFPVPGQQPNGDLLKSVRLEFTDQIEESNNSESDNSDGFQKEFEHSGKKKGLEEKRSLSDSDILKYQHSTRALIVNSITPSKSNPSLFGKIKAEHNEGLSTPTPSRDLLDNTDEIN